MLGSFLNRLLILAFGYTYPAYECFKVVEKNRPDIENLRFWCQYWILVALVTTFERIGDVMISWLPLYQEAKLGFYIYLWFPRTKGTTYVYESMLRPFLSQNEKEIDQTLLEFRARAADSLTLFIQKFASIGQAKFLEILQFVMLQSHSIGSRYTQAAAAQGGKGEPNPEQYKEVSEEEVAPPMVRSRRSFAQQPKSYNSARRPTQAYESYARADDGLKYDDVEDEEEYEEVPAASNIKNGEEDEQHAALHPSRAKKTE